MSVDAKVESLPPAKLREAVAALWRIQPPGPCNLFQAPEFLRLRDICESLYPNAGASKDAFMFALSHALGALGLPSRLPPANRDLALHAELAAARLHGAFERSEASRVYLCPLDKADELPPLKFGPNRIGSLTTNELEGLVDLPRLKRTFANRTFDAQRFSEFTWLVIKQTYPLDRTPAQRAIPWLFQPAGRDWGAIEPHQQRFPAPLRMRCSRSC